MNIELKNPGFAPPYDRQGGDKHLHVARGWRAWWSLERAEDSHGGEHHRPEYYCKRYGEQGVLACQGWQTTHATHRAGVYQVAALPVGARITALQAEIRARYFARQPDGKRGELALRLGLLDGAGDDGTDEGIQWGEWRGQTDGSGWDGEGWEALSASLSAPVSGQVTIFVESRCRWPVRNNHAFVEGARLSVVGGEPVVPDPEGDVVQILSEIRDLVAGIYGFLGVTFQEAEGQLPGREEGS